MNRFQSTLTHLIFLSLALVFLMGSSGCYAVADLIAVGIQEKASPMTSPNGPIFQQIKPRPIIGSCWKR
jgi:hypothetical protein